MSDSTLHSNHRLTNKKYQSHFTQVQVEEGSPQCIFQHGSVFSLWNRDVVVHILLPAFYVSDAIPATMQERILEVKILTHKLI